MAAPHDRTLEAIAPFLNALNCGALLVDRSGRVRRVNDRFCAMTGRSREELVDHETTSLYGSHPYAEKLRERLAKFSEPFEGEFLLPRPGGDDLPVIMSGRPLGAAPPLADYRLVTFVDLSGQKKAATRQQEEFEVVSRLSDTVIEQALELKRYNEKLEEKVGERTRELHDANMEAIYMLAVASEAKDADTGAHVRRIQQYTYLLSKELGLSERVSEQYGYSAILHDVGKMIVPDHILKKPGPLDSGERETMQLHCIAGERILSKKPFFEIARRIARSHHENWDGSGYPDGLKGEAIPLPARIVHLADIFDALTNERIYKPPWTEREAAAHIEKGRGTQFDPNVIHAFRELLDSKRFVPRADDPSDRADPQS